MKQVCEAVNASGTCVIGEDIDRALCSVRVVVKAPGYFHPS